MENIILNDFQLVSQWIEDSKGQRWAMDDTPRFLIDGSTGRRYWNESPNCVRVKCFLLTLGTPVVHTIAVLVNTAYRIVRLVSFFHFWKWSEAPYSLKERIKDAGIDALRIIASPVAIVALECAALYGIVSPYNGRKLYASIERAQYNHFILAPCFQPEPVRHAFGGDPDQRDEF